MRVVKYSFCSNEIDKLSKVHVNSRGFQKALLEVAKEILQVCDSIINDGHSKETDIQNKLISLTSLKSAENLQRHIKGFFGYGSRGGDLSYKDTTIELKYMREGDKLCEIRNALGQTLENAIISNLNNTILLVWDEEYSKRDWDEKSEKFISMFINNPFGINFAVIRIRVYENHCTADIYL